MSSRERKRRKKVVANARPAGLEVHGPDLSAAKSVERQVDHNCRPADEQQASPEGSASSGGELPGKNIAKYDKHQNDIDQQADSAGWQQYSELAHFRAGNQQNGEGNGKYNSKYGVDLLKRVHRIKV